MVLGERIRPPGPDFSTYFGVELNKQNFELAAHSFAIGFNSAALWRVTWRKRNELVGSKMDVVRGEIFREEAYARGHAQRVIANFYVDGKRSGFPFNMQKALRGENARLILAALEKMQDIRPLEKAALLTAQVLETVSLQELAVLEEIGLERLELQWLAKAPRLTYLTLQALQGLDDETPSSIGRLNSLQFLLSLPSANKEVGKEV